MGILIGLDNCTLYFQSVGLCVPDINFFLLTDVGLIFVIFVNVNCWASYRFYEQETCSSAKWVVCAGIMILDVYTGVVGGLSYMF